MADAVSHFHDPSGYRRALHWASMATAFALFPLVLVGAGVTSKDAGMAYADWPTSQGHLLNPPQWWEGEHTRWEHGHRLLGWFVGFSAIVLTITAWPNGGLVRWLSLGALMAISAQGVLGGLRVTQISTLLAMVHGIWGQVCFCLAALTAMVTSRSWIECGPPVVMRSGRALPRLSLIGTASLFIQLILGAALRHFSGGHALVAHVLWAIPVVFLSGWIVMWVLGVEVGSKAVHRLAICLGVLVVVQLMLGGLSWLVTLDGAGSWSWPHWVVPSSHVAIGALLLATSILLTLFLHRVVGRNLGNTRTSAFVVSAA